MQSRKQQLAELHGLNAKTIEAVRNLNDDEQIRAAAERYHHLQDELRRITTELSTTLEGYSEPGLGYNAQQDASVLLAGGSVETLTSPGVESTRAKLIRQLHAVQAALPSAEAAVSEVHNKVARGELQRLRPTALRLVGKMLDDLDQVRQDAELWAEFCTLLSRNGIPVDRRPGEWQLTILESLLLFGGGGLPGLATYTPERRRVWKIDGKD